MSSESSPSNDTPAFVSWAGLLFAVPLACALYWTLGTFYPDLPHVARTTAALTLVIGTMWITEALPLAATSLLPLVLFPLAGIMTFTEAAAPYADYLVFVYLGGFMLALAIERWNLHRRIALLALLAVGTQPALLIGGLMIATAFISMWVSNTATTAMMLPLGLSLVKLITEQAAHHELGSLSDQEAKKFAIAMMLGIAYSATIGGLGTLIGTPTNLAMASFAEQAGVPISFANWMLFGIPLVLVYLIVTWVLLTKFLYRLPRIHIPNASEFVRGELLKLGRISRGECVVTVVFVITACFWLIREPLTKNAWLLEHFPNIKHLNDGMIALAGAVVLFAIPIDAKRRIFALDWPTANRLPWGVLLLFGGGLSLAEAVKRSHLADAIGEQVAAWGSFSPLLLVVLLTAMVIFASEFTSNVATVVAVLPIMISVAAGIGCDPLLLIVATGVAASCAFMLPVGTPPNAIAFGTGYVPQGQMMRAGLFLNLLGIVLIPLAVYTLGVWVLGIRTQ